MIKVMLVDDHNIVRQGLRLMLEETGEIAVVGEAADGAEALDKIGQLAPDVVIMDVAMRGLDGLTATRLIKEENPGIKILALTMREEPQYVAEMLKAGASGYLLKSAVADDLFRAVKAVHRGESFLQPEVARMVIDGFVVGRKNEIDASDLTQREKEILQFLAQGLSNHAVAQRLHISPRTVQVHRANLMKKLGLHNQRELVLYAVRRGLIAT